MYYFAYGSNMLTKRLENRVGKVNRIGNAVLKDHTIIFNKLGKDESGKTNIIFSKGALVEGVVFELTNDQQIKLDKNEVGYSRVPINVEIANQVFSTEVYIANSDTIKDDLLPTKKYLQYLIDGAIEHNFSPQYIDSIKATKTI